MKVLFAAAELAPVARVGGLAEAAGGLVRALRRQGTTVDVVLPDYGGVSLDNEETSDVTVPAWAGTVQVRKGVHADAGPLHLVATPLLSRPHPYVDTDGEPWPDNDARFMGFTAAVAALSDDLAPDVVHLHDWHTAAAVSFLGRKVSSVLTIHTLGYQGVMDRLWLERLPRYRRAFRWYGSMNPLAGGIQHADRISTVSPNYAAEILRPEQGMGLDRRLTGRGGDLTGIRNGIDTSAWNPASDTIIAAKYDARDLAGKDVCRAALLDEIGWVDDGEALVGVVSRLVAQKGIDLLLEAVHSLSDLPARLIVLGSGEPELAAALRNTADRRPHRVWFHDGYAAGLAHRIFAGVDLLAMPSRFEPCGLAQMQAMAYGTIPIVTPVGGLVDTVIDADADRRGNGFVSTGVDTPALVDALHRGVRAVRLGRRRAAIQRRGMAADWSWDRPAAEYRSLYEGLATS